MKTAVLTLLSLCVLVVSQPAEAVVFVTISANGESISCDNSSGQSFGACHRAGFDTTLKGAVITFSGTVGGYGIVNLTVVANTPGSAIAFVTASATTIVHL